MPDVQNRRDQEQRLATALSAIFAQQVAVARTGRAIDWLAIENQSREKLAASLVVIYLLMLQGMEDSFDLHFVDSQAIAQATAYATARSSAVAATMVGNMRSTLSAAATQAIAPGGSTREFSATLDSVFSDTRAERVAATEITAAASQAEGVAAQEINRQRASRRSTALDEPPEDALNAIWQTAADDRVCPICNPLDQTSADEWGMEFPGGPPAHPNCRCYLSWI